MPVLCRVIGWGRGKSYSGRFEAFSSLLSFGQRSQICTMVG
jgi:hypothetical protein